ncbi:MAG: ribonuclease HII [bacterium]|nr:ribonuclease HII [bacterium]
MTAGVDEAGRGALCGRVYAAACILKKNIIGLNDSKKLSRKKRFELYQSIIADSYYAVAYCDVAQINKIGILKATLLAMKKAVVELLSRVNINLLIVDGPFKIPELSLKQKALIKADQKFKNVMAASILAKVERDTYMLKFAEKFPNWEFEKHMGYATKKHLEMIKKFGIIKGFHRKDFV